VITPAPKQRPDTGHVRRGDMTDKEREAILSQQRQRQYDLEALSYEDPSLYKAAMDKQAADGAAFTAADDMESRGAIQALGDYQTGKSRRDLVNFFAPDKGFLRDSAEKIMGGGSDNFGLGVADLALLGGVADGYDGLKYMADQSLQYRLKKRQIEQRLIDQGLNRNSIDFRIEMARQLPRQENSGEAMFDFALGAFEGAAAAKIAKLSFEKIGNFFKRFNPNASRLPDAANAAEDMARQILELRAAGRSDEVTEQMMAAADDQYMFANTPLDMSQEARMARASEQEYLGDYFHGSNLDFSGFDRSTRGTFLTDSPAVADSYVGRDGGIIYPALVRGGSDFPVVQAGGEFYSHIPLSGLPDELGYLKNDAQSNRMSTDEIVSRSGEQRLPGVIFEDVVDPGPNIKQYLGETSEMADERLAQSQLPSDIINVGDPRKIRSKFARFDPEFSNLSNLSASILGAIGFTGLAASLKERESGGDI